MFQTPVEALQALTPFPDPRLTNEDLDEWHPSVITILRDAGFLVPMDCAKYLQCPDCGRLHHFIRHPDHPAQAIASCHLSGVTTLPASAHQDWTIDHGALATWIGEQLGATAAPVVALPDLAWRWNRLPIAGARRVLVVIRTWSTSMPVGQWHYLGLAPKAIMLSFGAKPIAASSHDPAVFTASLWSYIDDADDDLRLAVDDLMQAILATESTQAKPQRSIAGKRAARSRAIGLLREELTAHLHSSQDALRHGHPMLPRPAQKELARRLGLSAPTVNRCLKKDKTPEACRIQHMWEMAHDESEVRAFSMHRLP